MATRDNNKINGAELKDTLSQIQLLVQRLMELTAEHPETGSSVGAGMEDLPRLSFQSAERFDRPTEFLQCLLDLIRAEFEPLLLGTTMLNSNLSHFFEEIADGSVKFGYLSLVSEQGQDFQSFWQEHVIPYKKQLGYSSDQATSALMVCTTGKERYGVDFMLEVDEVTDTLPSIGEVDSSFKAEFGDTESANSNGMVTGYCVDPALVGRIRVSLWFITKTPSFEPSADLH